MVLAYEGYLESRPKAVLTLKMLSTQANLPSNESMVVGGLFPQRLFPSTGDYSVLSAVAVPEITIPPRVAS